MQLAAVDRPRACLGYDRDALNDFFGGHENCTDGDR